MLRVDETYSVGPVDNKWNQMNHQLQWIRTNQWTEFKSQVGYFEVGEKSQSLLSPKMGNSGVLFLRGFTTNQFANISTPLSRKCHGQSVRWLIRVVSSVKQITQVVHIDCVQKIDEPNSGPIEKVVHVGNPKHTDRISEQNWTPKVRRKLHEKALRTEPIVH